MEATLSALPPFRCIEHDVDLRYDRKQAFTCERCDGGLTVRSPLVTPTVEKSSASDAKIKAAYRIYALVYPIVALFACWFVWRASVRQQIRYFREGIRRAGKGPGFLLDVGTGDGSLTKLALGGVENPPVILGVDLSEAMLKKASRTLSGVKRKILYASDIGSAALPKGAYPAITCFGTVHLFTDPVNTLRRIGDLLTGDGVMVGSYLLLPGTPRRDRVVAWCKEKGLLSTTYTEAELDALFAEAGLTYVDKVRNGQMLLFTVRRSLG
jgi:SAM-dependent methyltransferase